MQLVCIFKNRGLAERDLCQLSFYPGFIKLLNGKQIKVYRMPVPQM